MRYTQNRYTVKCKTAKIQKSLMSRWHSVFISTFARFYLFYVFSLLFEFNSCFPSLRAHLPCTTLLARGSVLYGQGAICTQSQ